MKDKKEDIEKAYREYLEAMQDYEDWIERHDGNYNGDYWD
jgi:hypothetical protein